jgi:hypothetical protein
MHRFEKKLDIAYNTRLAQLWVFRSWLKAGGMLAAGLLLLLLAAYTLPALTRVSAGAAGDWRVRAGDDTTDDENRSSVPPGNWRARAGDAGPQPTSRFFRWSRVAVNVAGVISFAAIAVTGFYSYFLKGAAMTGYRLMVHVAAAPVFMVAAVAVALFWAHRNRFTAASGDTLIVLLRKLSFWTAAALLAPTVVSILLAMYPLAGPDDQQDLFQVHRWCAMGFAGAASLFGLFALLAWRKRSAR